MSYGEKNNKARKPAWKWGVSLVAFFLILILIGRIGMEYFMKPYISRKIKEAVHESTRKAYGLDFESLELGLLKGNVTIREIKFYPDSARLDSTLLWDKVNFRTRISADRLSIKSLSYWQLLMHQKLSIHGMEISTPNIDYRLIKSNQLKADESGIKSFNRYLYKAIQTYLNLAIIDQIRIQNAILTIFPPTEKDTLLILNDLDMNLSDVKIDSQYAKMKSPLMKNIKISGQSLIWNIPDKFYRIKTGEFGISTFKQRVFIDSLKLKPTLPRYLFSQKIGMETDRIRLLVKHVEVNNLDRKGILNWKKLKARHMIIDKASLRVFHDKKMPAAPNQKTIFPRELLQEIPVPFHLDSLHIMNSRISYSEQKNLVPEPGTINFENVNAKVFNLTNWLQNLQGDSIITIDSRSIVMNEGKLHVIITIPLNDTLGTHTIRGSMGPMPIKTFNPVLENLAFIHVNSGQIKSLHFHMKLDKAKATGAVTMNYEDLNVDLLDKKSLEEKGVNKLKALLANTFIINKNNHGNSLHASKIRYKHHQQKSIFSYWWKSLLSGLLDNVKK